MAGALIGALRVSLSAETSAFEAGMKRSQRTAQRTASSIQGSFKGVGNSLKAGLAGFIGAISIGSIVAVGKAALDYAGSLGEVSQQLGVTTRDLQVFRYAAGQVGVSQSELETGLSKLTVTLGKVAAGAKAPIAALNAIGITVDEIKGKDTGEAFRIIADGLSKVTDRSERAAVELALFGRSGAQLDNLLAGGSSALNELALAADQLGIVLSDEQIQKADQTADKLEAMKTVLSARIAGVVADNADAILQLADALSDLVGTAARAAGAIANFYARAKAEAANFHRDNPFLANLLIGDIGKPKQLGSSVTVKLPPARDPRQRGGSSVGQFLAGGGGGGRRGPKGPSAERLAAEAERKRLDALRDAHQFDQEILRAKADILSAERQMSNDFVERTALSIKLLDLERATYAAQLEYEVKAKEKTQAQADSLLALYDEKDAIERQTILAEDRAEAAEASARLDQVTLELDRNKLESEAQLAETAAEARDVQLRLLDLAYRMEKARLEAVLADEQASYAAKEEARRRLSALSETQGNDTKAVIQGTRGPWEEFANASTDAKKLEEAFQSVAVNGVGALTDGLLDAIEGTKSLGEAFQQVAQEIIRELLRIMIQKVIVQAIGSAIGMPGAGAAVPGFAGGGSFNILGRGGVDSNVLSLNGLPIARVSYGERLNISNDNGQMAGGISVHAPITVLGNATRETPDQVASAIRRRVATATRKGY
jgi:hypothetical protein